MRLFSILSIAAYLSFSTAFAADSEQGPTPEPRFRKAAILKARFGSDEIGRIREKAYSLGPLLNRTIFGQELITEVLQASVIRYLEGFGHHSREPEHINIIGFTGSGKTDLIQKLSEIGIKVILLNAQSYVGGNEEKFAKDINEKIGKSIEEGRPVILAVDEIDKIPEITFENGVPVEVTSQFIGDINSIISEGRINVGTKPLVLSNVMVITMMNYPPTQIDTFSEEVLQQKKSFYDYTLEDFAKVDAWIRTNPGSQSRILARLFRANTVSRLAPNSYFMQPFTPTVYEEIVKHLSEQTEKSYAADGPKAEQYARVHVDASLVKFLLENGVVPSSGARKTVRFVNASLDDLVGFAQKIPAPGAHGLDRPRKIRISMTEDQKRSRIEVTPQVYRQGGLIDLPSFSVEVEYVPGTRLFRRPQELIAKAPSLKAKDSLLDLQALEKEPRITKKQIRALRFPKTATLGRGLAKGLAEVIHDQQSVLPIIESDVIKYLSRDSKQKREPLSRVLAGFPGNPSVQILEEVSRRTEIPLVRVNLENYGGDESSAVGEFMSTLDMLIREEVGFDEETAQPGRFILLIEGLDKVFQIDGTGVRLERPVTGLLSEILSKGKAEFTDFDEDYAMDVSTTDVRDGLIYVTLNLPVEKFGLQGDPRLTSVGDVERTFTHLTKYPADLKDLLSTMYLPETISTVLPRLTLLRPYSEKSYHQIIGQQLEKVVHERLHDDEDVNVAQIEVHASDAYLEYLYSESVIPSEGARNTETMVRNLASTHLEAALDRLPRDRRYSGEPLEMHLDYDPATTSVKASIVLKSAKLKVPLQVLNQKVTLMFPSVKAFGKMKAYRVETAAHEFGHAFVSALLGQRMERILAVPVKQAYGGFVSFKERGDSAAEEIASLYATLAARALERMVSSEDPRQPLSVLNITKGASMDIEMATESLYEMIHAFGLAPQGGTLDRRAKFAPHDAASSFAPLTAEDVKRLGLILRDLEDYLVEQLLEAHPMDWYIDKISRLAQEGAMTEKEFYELIEYPFPGDNRELVYRNRALEERFAQVIREPSESIQTTRTQRTSQVPETVEERLQRFVQFFAATLDKRLSIESTCSDLLTRPSAAGE